MSFHVCLRLGGGILAVTMVAALLKLRAQLQSLD